MRHHVAGIVVAGGTLLAGAAGPRLGPPRTVAGAVRAVPTVPTVTGRDTGITTDTGDLAPRAMASVQYATPLACVAAAADARAFAAAADQPDAPDTSVAASRPAVVALARRCGARFTLETTAKAALPDLFTLALWEANDTLAQAALSALLAQAPTPETQGTQLVWAVQHALATVSELWALPPARVALAEAAVARLDALGDAVWAQRVTAHTALVEFGRAYADWPLVTQQGAQLLALAQGHLDVAGLDARWQAYQALMTVAWLRQPDSVVALAPQLRAAFSPPAVQQAVLTLCGIDGKAKAGRESSIALCEILHDAKLLPITEATPLATLTTAALGVAMPTPHALPPLRADFWFPAPKRTDNDSLHPAVPGRVTLLYHVTDAGGGGENCAEGRCARLFAPLRAFVARYGAEVAATVVVDAEGYTVMDVPGKPQEVADSYRWFFQQYLGLPVAVAVRIRPVKAQRPPPDGRITYATFPQDQDAYNAGPFLQVTNRRGEVVYKAWNQNGKAARFYVAQVVAHEVALR